MASHKKPVEELTFLEMRKELVELGHTPGPINERNKAIFIRQLLRLRGNAHRASSSFSDIKREPMVESEGASTSAKPPRRARSCLKTPGPAKTSVPSPAPAPPAASSVPKRSRSRVTLRPNQSATEVSSSPIRAAPSQPAPPAAKTGTVPTRRSRSKVNLRNSTSTSAASSTPEPAAPSPAPAGQKRRTRSTNAAPANKTPEPKATDSGKRTSNPAASSSNQRRSSNVNAAAQGPTTRARSKTPVRTAPPTAAPAPAGRRGRSKQPAKKPESAATTQLDVKLAQAMRNNRALLDPSHTGKGSTTRRELWMKVGEAVDFSGPVSTLMKMWEKLMTQYRADKESNTNSEIYKLLKFTDEEEAAPTSSKASPTPAAVALAETLLGGQQEAVHRVAKRPAAMNETPVNQPIPKRARIAENVASADDGLDAFGTFIAQSLRQLDVTQRNAAIDDVYSIFRNYRRT